MPTYVLNTHTTAFDNDANNVVVVVDDTYLARVRTLVDVYRYGKLADSSLYAIEAFDSWPDFYPSVDTDFDERLTEVAPGVWQAPDEWYPSDEDGGEELPRYNGDAQTMLVSDTDLWFRILPSGEGAEVNSITLPLWLLGLAPKPAYVDQL